MILSRHNPVLPIPGAGLATLSVLNPDPASLVRETALMRLSPGKFDMLTAGRLDELGHPVYWTSLPDGTGIVWPKPDRDYQARARDTLGRDPDARRNQVNVFPVLEHAAAISRQVEEARAAQALGPPGPRPEHFGRPPPEEME